MNSIIPDGFIKANKAKTFRIWKRRNVDFEFGEVKYEYTNMRCWIYNINFKINSRISQIYIKTDK